MFDFWTVDKVDKDKKILCITSIISEWVKDFIVNIDKIGKDEKNEYQTEKVEIEKVEADANVILKESLYPLQCAGALENVKGNQKFIKQIIKKLVDVEANIIIEYKIKQWMSIYKEVIADYFMIKVIRLNEEEYKEIIDNIVKEKADKDPDPDLTLRMNIINDLAFNKDESASTGFNLSGELEKDLKEFTRINLKKDIAKIEAVDSKDAHNILSSIREWWATNRKTKDESPTGMLRQVVYSSEAEIDEKDSD